jgi:predicted secreted hydrolase
VAVFALTLVWLALARRADTQEIRAGVDMQQALGGADTAGYARATAPPSFEFPRDHGPHPAFRIEWWYFTGNLQTSAGRRFGYQLTFFRSALAPERPLDSGATQLDSEPTPLDSMTATRTSRWAARQAYMAHFAVTDVAGRRFAAFERFGRDALGLAGARAAPFTVWLEDWSVRAAGSASFPVVLSAADSGVVIRLELDAGRAPVAQGDRGLSRKGAEPGNASHYYSMPRMPTRGRIQLEGRSYDVTGESWMDREWSTSALGAGRVGWDWFALQLSDGRELMYYQLRDTLGRADPFSAGSVSGERCRSEREKVSAGDVACSAGEASALAALTREDVQLHVERWWDSPRGGARYPAEWRIRVPSQALDLRVRPVVADQELNLWVRYWEGAVDVTGSSRGRTVTGRGYVELTGYARIPRAAASLHR